MSNDGRPPARVFYCESNKDGTIGGSHHCLFNLVAHLDRSAFEPIVAFYEQHALMPAFRGIAETIVLEQPEKVTWGAGVPGFRPRVVARRVVNSVRTARQVLGYAQLLRRRRVDLVHLNNSIVCHHEWMLAAALARVPCVSHERGLSERYSSYERWMSSRLALVVPMSAWIRDHMIARGVDGRNMRVLYDGVNPHDRAVATDAAAMRERWQLAAGQPVFGMVGNIREWKGQEVVIRALIDVVQTHPDVVCFFVGAASPEDAPFEARLRALIENAGIARNVRFTGYQENVPDFVNIMAFVVHASIQAEPFGMVVLEAMAQCKAVVGSRAGGVVEMVVEESTGLTFPPGDSKTLAGHLLRLLNNPTLAAEMGRNAYRRLLQEFALGRYVSDVQAAYRAILERGQVGSISGHDTATKVSNGSHSVVV
jgi:glycosyltransferase involved in cell wall biosynthesis